MRDMRSSIGSRHVVANETIVEDLLVIAAQQSAQVRKPRDQQVNIEDQQILHNCAFASTVQGVKK